MPPIKRQPIVFGACPFGLGMTLSCHACVPDILFSYLANLHGYISLGQNKELIIFVDMTLFSRSTQWEDLPFPLKTLFWFIIHIMYFDSSGVSMDSEFF